MTTTFFGSVREFVPADGNSFKISNAMQARSSRVILRTIQSDDQLRELEQAYPRLAGKRKVGDEICELELLGDSPL